MIPGLLKKAKELFKKPDIIIDLYDFTIVWMSKELSKILGFTKNELIGQAIPETFAMSETNKRAKAIEHMSKTYGNLKVNSKSKMEALSNSM